MAHHSAKVRWERGDQLFTDNRYSRNHTWTFDGGVSIPASASPTVVPLPLSSENAVDPEEAFVASLSSCHMLWFLALAAKEGYSVDSYADHAVGTMGKNVEGRIAMVLVELRPEVHFSGARVPTAEQLTDLHDRAHDLCFIANSIRAEVRCTPTMASDPTHPR